MITVLLADHHELFRKGLKSALEARPEFKVCGEATDGAEAARLAAELRPDVCVMALTLPGLGTDVFHSLANDGWQCRVIVVSPDGANEVALRTFASGARGFLVQSDSSDEFITAVTTVAAGGEYLSRATSLSQARSPSAPLTSREREVIRWVAEGMRTSEVAELLGISRKTVETHRMAIMRKLQLHSVAQVVRYAIRHRLVEP